MKYQGKIYAKLGPGKYVPFNQDTDDIDRMVKENTELKAYVESIKKDVDAQLASAPLRFTFTREELLNKAGAWTHSICSEGKSIEEINHKMAMLGILVDFISDVTTPSHETRF